MKKRLLVVMLALAPLADVGTVMAAKNVLNSAGGGASFGENVLSGGKSSLGAKNVLNPKGADMNQGNAMPSNKADMNQGNAMPSNQADMNQGNALGQSGSALKANNVIEKRSANLEAGNVMNAEGIQSSGRSAFSTTTSRNALGEGSAVDARRNVGPAEGVDSRREVSAAKSVDARRSAFRAKSIQETSEAFGNDKGASAGGIGGALELTTPGSRSGTATVGGAGSVLSEGTSAFSEAFRSRLAERNAQMNDDGWREAKSAFDGKITETRRERTGFGRPAFD